MEEETSVEVEVDQLIFSRIHFSGLMVGLSYQFVILVHLSGWPALEILRLSSEVTELGKTTLAIRIQNDAFVQQVSLDQSGQGDGSYWVFGKVESIECHFGEWFYLACKTCVKIEQSFQELCEVGQHSGLFLAQGRPSYHRLTLEFLSTLTVNKTRQAIVSITFQLRNTIHEMPIAQFNDIFRFTGVVTKMSFEFSHGTDKFWQLITTGRKFSANRAKSSSIRNPVLRIFQKACVCYPFARVEHGSVTRDELFMLWQILHKQPPLNLGHFMIKHLERAAKKKGTLCVGAVVSAIAFHLGVQLNGLVADNGESPSPLLDITFLKRTAVIALDKHGQI